MKMSTLRISLIETAMNEVINNVSIEYFQENSFTADQMLDYFLRFGLACGFSSDSMEGAVIEKALELDENLFEREE